MNANPNVSAPSMLFNVRSRWLGRRLTSHMKIHLQPAMPCAPSSLMIAYARMLPNADTKRLIMYQSAILRHPVSVCSVRYHALVMVITSVGPRIVDTSY